ncbi:MAG: NADH-quinone oxidoreductase subunit N [Desulfovermiculus sp.]
MQFEFVAPIIPVQAVLPQSILVLTGLVVLVVDVLVRDKSRFILPALSMIGVLISSLFIVNNLIPDTDVYQSMVYADGFSAFLNLTIWLILILTILVSVNYQRFFLHMASGEYYCLLLFAAVGMSFMASSGHLILIFVALELMSVCVYVLTGFHRNNDRSVEAALKYFLLGAFASAFLLLGFAFLYGATGTLDLPAMSAFIAENPETITSGWLILGLLLSIVGFGFKISMVPFHMWTPDVYQGAPTVVTAFMATGVKAAAIAALVRVVMVALEPMAVNWTMILWVAAVATMFVGNIIALVQDDVKRMLAYSGIAHAGYMLIGFVAGTEMGQAGILYYLLAYALMNMGAFGVITLLGRQGEEYSSLSDFSGLGLKSPAMGLAMAIFMFSLAGIPPTAGFMGKFYIFAAAVKSGFIWLVILGAINSIISIYYYLRVIVTMYFSSPAENPDILPSTSPPLTVALSVAATGVLVMGVFPSLFWALAQSSIFALS